MRRRNFQFLEKCKVLCTYNTTVRIIGQLHMHVTVFKLAQDCPARCCSGKAKRESRFRPSACCMLCICPPLLQFGISDSNPLTFHTVSWSSCSCRGKSMRQIFLSLRALPLVTQPFCDLFMWHLRTRRPALSISLRSWENSV